MSQDVFVLVEHLRGQVSDIAYLSLAAGRQLADSYGGNLIGVLLGHGAQELGNDLACDQLWYVDQAQLEEFTPDAYIHALAELLKGDLPSALLLGHTTIGMDVASGLAARLGVALISQCQSFKTDAGSPKYVSQICAGKIMAEGDVPEPAAFITMVPGGYKPEDGRSSTAPKVETKEIPAIPEPRVKLVEYIEPDVEDVDISKEALLIAVGRGLMNEDDMELIQELADGIGAAICASRPIIDKGWLPTSRLVGKSGKSVKPKMYLALGISGAPEHVESVMDSDMIIAVNTDAEAPIFDIAKYGVNVDMMDLVEALNEQLKS